MSKEQLIALLDAYLVELKQIKPHRADYALRNPGHTTALGHAVFMCTEVKALIRLDKMEKAHRWLGFIQAILWTQGIYTIDEMRKHNQ